MNRLKLLGSLGVALAIAGVAQAQQPSRVPPPPPPTSQRAAPPPPVALKPDSAASQAMHVNPMVMVPLRSDIAAKGGITIGSGSGVSGAWGGSINVSGSMGKMSSSGLDCVFAIAYTVQNPGAIATGSYTNKVVANSGAWWASQIQPGPVLGKGASQTMHTWLKLKPSSGHTVSLQLDAGNQVSEQNENNNQVQIHVTVNGPCQP